MMERNHQTILAKKAVKKAIEKAHGSLWVKKSSLPKGTPSFMEGDGIKVFEIDGTTYYTRDYISEMETDAARDVQRILYTSSWAWEKPSVIEKEIHHIEEKISQKNGKEFRLHKNQIDAVRCMVNNSFCVITGGPGTGKTCTLQVAVQVMEALHPGVDVRFTAPTGKAAKRITESTGRRARTVQKELCLTYSKTTPSPFEGDVLIVDEASMLDMETAAALFKSIRSGSRLILVGDTEQLPSVKSGAVLRDLLWANTYDPCNSVIPSVMLTHTYRQANESALFYNICKCREGKADEFKDDENEFRLIDLSDDLSKQVDQLLTAYEEEVKRYGIDNVAVLLPYRRHPESFKGMPFLCTYYINRKVQERLNPKTIGKRYLVAKTAEGDPITYIEGDPVIQLVNREEVVNGDVGKVAGVEGSNLVVEYPECEVKYSQEEIQAQLTLAYALTIHKSQGSEYKSVVMALSNDHKAMLVRNLVYTGITRAKERCVLLKQQEALERALAEDALEMTSISDGVITFFAEKLRSCQKVFDRKARNLVRTA